MSGSRGWALVRREEARPLAWEPVGARTREEKIRDHLFWSLQRVKVTNCELKRFGEANDGGYSSAAISSGRSKAGYWYGISGYDGWGCDVSKQLGVPVHR